MRKLGMALVVATALSVCLSGCVNLPHGESGRLDQAVADADFASIGTVICESSGGPGLFDPFSTVSWYHNVDIEGSTSEAAVVAQLEKAGFEKQTNDRYYFDPERRVTALISTYDADHPDGADGECNELPDSGKVVVYFAT